MIQLYKKNTASIYQEKQKPKNRTNSFPQSILHEEYYPFSLNKTTPRIVPPVLAKKNPPDVPINVKTHKDVNHKKHIFYLSYE